MHFAYIINNFVYLNNETLELKRGSLANDGCKTVTIYNQ